MPALIVELLQEALKRFQHVAEGSAEGLSTLQWTEQLGPALAEPVADELKPQLQG